MWMTGVSRVSSCGTQGCLCCFYSYLFKRFKCFVARIQLQDNAKLIPGARYISKSTILYFTTFLLMSSMTSEPWITHAEIVIALLPVIQCIWWEWYDLATGSKYRKHQYEANYCRSPIHSRTKNIIVLDKPIRSVLSQIQLGKESSGIVQKKSAVGTMLEHRHCRWNNCSIPVIQLKLWRKLVCDPERQWNEESKNKGEWHPLIASSSAVHEFCKPTPADCLFEVSDSW